MLKNDITENSKQLFLTSCKKLLKNKISSIQKTLDLSNIKILSSLSNLESLELSSQSSESQEKLIIIQKLKYDYKEDTQCLKHSLNLNDFYESILKEFENCTIKIEDLLKRLELLVDSNNSLQDALREMEEEKQQYQQKLLAFETVPKFEENPGFDSLSLEKPIIYGYSEEDYLEKLKVLEDENSKLRAEIESLRSSYSSLHYSTSEEDIISKKSSLEEIMDTSEFNKVNEYVYTIPPRPQRPKTTLNENIFIQDDNESSISDDELPSPQLDASTDELEFETTL
ncbi:hypothetical protein SteCoe_34266 [Stentor coeruleus]|uniref:Uncharacterized protein n=1 Tax=Stentor coeruleus TaxID=5963 RepID=A0A1R2AUW7_9CILI|nr:hypothetical protein SteCoe_34266 [Stentor coeruleus]